RADEFGSWRGAPGAWADHPAGMRGMAFSPAQLSVAARVRRRDADGRRVCGVPWRAALRLPGGPPRARGPAALDAQNPKTRDRERQHTYPDGGLSRLAREPAWPALRRLRVAAPLVGHRPRRLLVFDPGVLPAHRRGEAG